MRTPLVLAAVLLAAPALAQDRPQLFPTRDVAVTYRVMGAGPQAQGTEMTMAWNAAGQLLRTDLPGGVGYMITDQQNRRGFMVMEAQRMIMDVPMEQAVGMTDAMRNARFTRGANATIAGTTCTTWTFQTPEQNGTACVTADGVMLRSQANRGNQQVTMEAVRVTYGAQNPARFQRPQGYQTMQAPTAPPGAMPPPGAAMPPKPN